MKFAIVTSKLDATGGVEIFNRDIKNILTERGHDVSIYGIGSLKKEPAKNIEEKAADKYELIKTNEDPGKLFGEKLKKAIADNKGDTKDLTEQYKLMLAMAMDDGNKKAVNLIKDFNDERTIDILKYKMKNDPSTRVRKAAKKALEDKGLIEKDKKDDNLKDDVEKEKKKFVADMKFGIRYLYNEKVLRRLVVTTALIGVCYSMGMATVVLFIIKELELPKQLFGVILTIQSLGAISGAFMAPRLSKKFGRSRVMTFGITSCSLVLLLNGFAPNIYVYVSL